MPRHWGGPYLWLKPAETKLGKAATWVICDRERKIYTRAKADERVKADEMFQQYLSQVYPDGLSEVARVFEPAQPRIQCVYFVSCEVDGFPIKIGLASNISHRLVHLQNALPYKVCLLGSMPGDRETEHDLHVGFSNIWLRGEWYRREPELLDYVHDVSTGNFMGIIPVNKTRQTSPNITKIADISGGGR